MFLVFGHIAERGPESAKVIMSKKLMSACKNPIPLMMFQSN